LTDGIVDRHTQDGGTFGVDGLRRAVERADAVTAAATAMAIQHAVTECWSEPLEDDATVVVLAVE
jgi:serine phosphatase RsbU (regulator of sigma subunit)